MDQKWRESLNVTTAKPDRAMVGSNANEAQEVKKLSMEGACKATEAKVAGCSRNSNRPQEDTKEDLLFRHSEFSWHSYPVELRCNCQTGTGGET